VGPATKRAVTFDSGADSSPIEQAQQLGLTIELILLTRAHRTTLLILFA
jgi:hypothetical protein